MVTAPLRARSWLLLLSRNSPRRRGGGVRRASPAQASPRGSGFPPRGLRHAHAALPLCRSRMHGRTVLSRGLPAAQGQCTKAPWAQLTGRGQDSPCRPRTAGATVSPPAASDLGGQPVWSERTVLEVKASAFGHSQRPPQLLRWASVDRQRRSPARSGCSLGEARGPAALPRHAHPSPGRAEILGKGFGSPLLSDLFSVNRTQCGKRRPVPYNTN